jgi:putative DNA primase/helicase
MTAAYIGPPEPVRRLLNGLDGVRRSGAGWMARCPAHEDRQASLSVTAGDDGRALLYCHAGCTVEAVTGAAGLATADLFEPREWRVPRRSTSVVPSDPPTLYAIRNLSGVAVAVHERVDTPSGKRMSWRLPGGTPGLNGTPSAELPLYGSEQLGKWDASRPIIVCEGEKSALALLTAGFRALGTVTGAASAPNVAVLQALRGHHVILWPDADKAGREHMRRIADRLAGIAASVRLLTWPDAPEHGDAADLLDAASAAEVDRLIEAAQPLTAPGPVLVRLAAVQREPLHPLWDRYLYRGKLHVIEGDPDLGKTTLTLDLAARLSIGAAMPDGSPGIGPAGVVILGAEDGLADTVRPRLEAAGADLSRVVALTAIMEADGERMPALPLDLGAIEAAIREVDAVLVVIDPLMAFLDATVNSWRDQDVRRALAPLARLADRTACAIVLLRHLNKSSGLHAMYRGGGSIGIIGAARVGLLVAADPDDPERRIVATVKNNLAPHPPSLAFRLMGDDATAAARIEWLGESEHRASALLALRVDDPEEGGALVEAVEVLRTILAGGPVAAKDGEREAAAAGVKGRTLDRARKAAAVRSERVGGLGSAGYWQWTLAPKSATENLRPPYLESGALSVLSSGEAELRHTCGRCQQYAHDAELTISDGRYLHRQACEATA